MYYLGLDIGTSTICSVLVDSFENWKIINRVSMPNDSKIESTHSWENIQDPEKILNIVKQVLCVMQKKYNQIYCIGISCQMHGIVYIDSAGKALSPFYTWQDQRASLLLTGKNISYSTDLSQTLHINCPPGYGLATHYYHSKNNTIPQKTVSFCSIGDYVAMHLVHNKTVVSDSTMTDSYGALDPITRDYATTVLENRVLNSFLLPELVSSATIIGEFNNIPVVTAVGDNQCSFMGSIKNIRTDATISLGTSGQITSYIDSYENIRGIETRVFPGKGCILSGASLCGGYAYTLLKQFFQETLQWFGCSSDIDIFKKMDEISPLDNQNLLDFKPLFLGTRTNPTVKASINQLDSHNFTPQNLTASIEAGIVNELFEFFTLFPLKDKEKITRIFGTGSFFNKSPFMKDYCQKKFNLPVFYTNRNEEGAFGAIINASVAMKTFSSYAEAIDIINMEQ